MKEVRLITSPFNPGSFVGPFSNAHPGLGGICTFVGEVRGDEGVEALELSHYEPLTLPGMNTLADAALERFDLMGILVLHRTGLMYPGEPIVLVSAAARHRRDAIQAVDFTMDHLKSDSWFWKREKRADGWHWIE
ncbi:MAG: molybdenum cofactor biosynthesis protein MoaE, partial [Sphingomonadaceae bacterium]|nr:molybdenum cofactor biosynthesis protein MoaE [Sphingomonadaceae bacterium]